MGPSDTGDPLVNGRRDELADTDDAKDSDQNNRHFVPPNVVDRRLKLDADASGPNEAVHGRFAVVDDPALDCGDVDDRQHLVHNLDRQSLQPRRVDAEIGTQAPVDLKAYLSLSGSSNPRVM